jgi:uncharacterized protein (TIGR02265 family)
MYFGALIERTRRGGHPIPEVLAEAGIAISHYSFMGKYPLSDFMRLQTTCARRLEKSCGSFEGAVHELGRAALDIFFESLPGKTFRVLAGKDPQRMLAAAPDAYAFAISDAATRTHTRISERAGQMTFRADVLGPCHHVGVFAAALEGTGQTFRFELEQSALTEFTIRASW